MAIEYLPLGCFGKLPCYEDFLRGSVVYPTSRALQEWILGGREELGLESDEMETARPKETVCRRFLYGAPGSAELVAGVVRPSTDRGGHRSFPFMVYVHFPRRLYGRNYPLLPLGLTGVWDALDDAWESLANVATRAAFEEVVPSTLIPGPAPIAQAQSAYQSLQGEDARRIIDRSDARLSSLRRNLPVVLQQLRKGAEGVRIELPVSGEGDAASADVAFWMDLLNHQFMFRRFEPAVFVDSKGEQKKSHVLFVFGILRPSDYPIVLGCGGARAEVNRPARPSERDGGETPAEGGRLTFADLLGTRFGPAGKESGEPDPGASKDRDTDRLG